MPGIGDRFLRKAQKVRIGGRTVPAFHVSDIEEESRRLAQGKEEARIADRRELGRLIRKGRIVEGKDAARNPDVARNPYFIESGLALRILDNATRGADFVPHSHEKAVMIDGEEWWPFKLSGERTGVIDPSKLHQALKYNDLGDDVRIDENHPKKRKLVRASAAREWARVMREYKEVVPTTYKRLALAALKGGMIRGGIAAGSVYTDDAGIKHLQKKKSKEPRVDKERRVRDRRAAAKYAEVEGEIAELRLLRDRWGSSIEINRQVKRLEAELQARGTSEASGTRSLDNMLRYSRKIRQGIEAEEKAFLDGHTPLSDLGVQERDAARAAREARIKTRTRNYKLFVPNSEKEGLLEAIKMMKRRGEIR